MLGDDREGGLVDDILKTIAGLVGGTMATSGLDSR